MSNSLSAINPGMAGIQNGIRKATEAAAKIASADQFTADSPINVAQAMMELKQAELQVKASAEATRAIEDSLGYLLDEYA